MIRQADRIIHKHIQNSIPTALLVIHSGVDIDMFRTINKSIRYDSGTIPRNIREVMGVRC